MRQQAALALTQAPKALFVSQNSLKDGRRAWMWRSRVYMCPHTAVCVLVLLYMRPHPAEYVYKNCCVYVEEEGKRLGEELRGATGVCGLKRLVYATLRD